MKALFHTSGYYRVKVIPNQPQAEFRGTMGDGTIKIALTEAPEKGKANKELIAFLADQLGIRKESITISSGLTSRIKILSVSLE